MKNHDVLNLLKCFWNEENICDPVCKNGGQCYDDINGDTFCSCPLGYTGSSCGKLLTFYRIRNFHSIVNIS